MIPLIATIKLASFFVWTLYGGIWRYAGTPESTRVVAASCTASVGVGIGAALVPGGASISFALLTLDWMLTTMAVGGRRLLPRALRHYRSRQGVPERRILIAGAGPDAVFAFRCLRQQLSRSSSIVGFLDSTRARLRLKGLPVVSSMTDVSADMLVVPALPRSSFSAPTDEHRAIFSACKKNNVTFCWMMTTLASSPSDLPSKQSEPARVPAEAVNS